MPFVVQAHTDDHTLTVTTATAKEAFAKAVEWHITGRFTHVSISDDIKTYSLDAFSLAMALLEIAKTVGAAAELKAEGKWCRRTKKGWQRKFEDPTSLPNGKKLITPRDAADYITSLPKKESDLPDWRNRGADAGVAQRFDDAGAGPEVMNRWTDMSSGLTRQPSDGGGGLQICNEPFGCHHRGATGTAHCQHSLTV
jgi:hypothetical protein